MNLVAALGVYLFAFMAQEMITSSSRHMYCCYKMVPAGDAPRASTYAIETLELFLSARALFVKRPDADNTTCLNHRLNMTRCEAGIEAWNTLFSCSAHNPSQQILADPLLMWIPNVLLAAGVLFYVFLPDIFLALVCACHPGTLSFGAFCAFAICGMALRLASPPF